MTGDTNDNFCNKPIGPWIVGLVVMAVMMVFWVMMRREDIFQAVERESLKAPKPAVTLKSGEPVFPNPVQQAAMPNAQNIPNMQNMQPAAITKATPNGGMQLVGTNAQDSRFQNSLKDAVNLIIPSVCDIHARRIVRSPASQQAIDAQNLKFAPPFDGVIDKFIENKGYENIGAGVFVDQRGFILTNYHVTQEATDISVTVFGTPPRDYRAVIVAQDTKQDLALLKVKADGPFPEAKLGDSSFCQIGDYVIAIGSPFGIEQTVTSGIISGIRKSVVIETMRYENLFQTDASINRGSSGGPMVNLQGEVIGINTAIYAPTGVFSGTGFAIPINDCKDFLTSSLGRNYPAPVDKRGMFAGNPPQATAEGAPAPVRFGIEVMSIDDVIAQQFGVAQGQGVLVNRVADSSPASFAGISRGDIITAIAGVPITAKEDIPKVVSHFKAGDSVNVRIIRNGRTDEILIRLQ